MLKVNKFLFNEAGGNDGGGAGGSAGGDSGKGGNNPAASGGLFDDAGSGKEGASGGDGKGAAGKNGGTGGDGGGKDGSSVVIPENWKETLPQELKDLPSLAKVKDIPSLVKSYAHLEKMLGSEKIPVPQKGSTLEQLKDYFQKAGLPEDASEYKFDVAAKNVEKEFLEAFKGEAFKLNVLPAQAKGLVEWFAKVQETNYNNDIAAQQKSVKDGLDGLRKEWGAAHDEEMAKAKAAVREFTTPEEQDYIKKMGLGFDPTFIKMMAKVGATLAEDKIRGEGGTGGSVFTPSQAQIKIAEIKANVNGPYYDKNHAEHAATKKQVADLYAMAYPGPKVEARENA